MHLRRIFGVPRPAPGQKITVRQRLRLLLWVCLVCGGTGLLLTWTGVHCPIRYLTGIPCPGCGMTRACLTLAFGPGGLGDRLVRAFQYHPLVFVIPPLLLYAIFGKWPLFGGKKTDNRRRLRGVRADAAGVCRAAGAGQPVFMGRRTGMSAPAGRRASPK